LPRFSGICSHSPSVRLPASIRLPTAFFHLLLAFSSYFELLQPLVSFAVAQFASFHSFLDLSFLFLIVLDDEQQIRDDDQMDDEEKIGNNE
jgi:hypothetical protein